MAHSVQWRPRWIMCSCSIYAHAYIQPQMCFDPFLNSMSWVREANVRTDKDSTSIQSLALCLCSLEFIQASNVLFWLQICLFWWKTGRIRKENGERGVAVGRNHWPVLSGSLQDNVNEVLHALLMQSFCLLGHQRWLHDFWSHPLHGREQLEVCAGVQLGFWWWKNPKSGYSGAFCKIWHPHPTPKKHYLRVCMNVCVFVHIYSYIYTDQA